MTQLTSHAAIFLFGVRSPQVTLFSIPGIRNGLFMIFPILTANDGSTGPFYISAVLCRQILHVVPRDTALSFGYALRRFEEKWILTI